MIANEMLLSIHNKDAISLSEPGRHLVRLFPDLAARWAAQNTIRKETDSHIETLMALMLSDKWCPQYHMPIMFDQRGVNINGKNRLTAIARLNKPILVLVETGVPEWVVETIDTIQHTRQHYQAIKIHESVSSNKLCIEVINNWAQLKFQRRRKLTSSEITQFYLLHSPALDWIVGIRPKKRKIGQVPVWVAIAQCYEKSPGKAMLFAESFRQPTGDVQQARFLRDHVLRSEGGGASLFNALYGHTVYCLKRFLDGKEIKRISTDAW